MREDSWLDVWKEDSSTLVRSRAVSSPGGMCWRRKDTRRNRRVSAFLRAVTHLGEKKSNVYNNLEIFVCEWLKFLVNFPVKKFSKRNCEQ